MADLCAPCTATEHDRCIDLGEYQRDCRCGCAGIVNCPTCGNDVVLFADDPEDPSYAHGECCTWGWADTFDGCIRLDLSASDSGHALAPSEARASGSSGEDAS